MTKITSVPVNTPLLSGNEKKYLDACIETGWISSEGEFIRQFEDKFSQYIGQSFGVAVTNGSAALDIAVQALDIGPGDEVIVSTFTIISPVLSIVRCGATPVLVDSDPVTWNMNTDHVASRITSKTKAILVVHIYGLPVDMDPIIHLCKKHKLLLIEDAAEMHGQTYNGRKCGSFGDIATFSFYPNKHITTGEGGMILTNNPAWRDRCQKLRNLAFEPGRRFIHREMGWNCRMTNMQAALGLAQLENIETHLIRKRDMGRRYQERLKGLPGFELPLASTSYAENIYWVFGLIAETEVLCQHAIQTLGEAQVGTRPFFWCMHEQPVFTEKGMFKGERYPHAERMARNGFYVPSGIGLTLAEIDYVSDQLLKVNP